MNLITQPRSADPLQSTGVRYCVFRLGRSWYAMSATLIREIAVQPAIVPIPGCHPGLAGMCHFRSELIPVMRLDLLLGKGAVEPAENAKLIVVSESSGDWGLIADEISGLQCLQTFLSTDGAERREQANAVLGTATFRDEVINVLDPKSLCRLAQQLFDESWTKQSDLAETPPTNSQEPRSER